MPVLKSLFNKVVELKDCNFVKKETPTLVYSCDMAKFSKPAIL